MNTKNEKFKKIVDNQKYSLYKISQYTGIQYTTINQLYHGKQDINHCSAETVYILAEFFDVQITEIMNDFHFLENCKGKYKDFKYSWEYDQKKKVMGMNLDHDGEKIHIDCSHDFNNIKKCENYPLIARMIINSYLEEIEFKKSAKI